jgi:hypothetical protein
MAVGVEPAAIWCLGRADAMTNSSAQKFIKGRQAECRVQCAVWYSPAFRSGLRKMPLENTGFRMSKLPTTPEDAG